MRRFLLMFIVLLLIGPKLWAGESQILTKPDGSKYKIFVQDVRLVGIDVQYAQIYSSFISEAIQELDMFEVVTSQDLQDLVDYEQVKEVLACDSVSCLAEIGGVALADMMLTCNISKFPDNISVALNLSSVESLKKIKTSTEMLLGDTLYKVNQLLPLQTELLFSKYLPVDKVQQLELEVSMIKNGTALQPQNTVAENQLPAAQVNQSKLEKEKQAQAEDEVKKLQVEHKKQTETQLTPQQLRGMRTAAIYLGFIGVGGIISGATIYSKAQDKREQLKLKAKSDAENGDSSGTVYTNDKANNRLAAGGIATLVTGGVLTVTAVALWSSAVVKSKKQKRQLTAIPVFGPDGAHLTLSYRW